MTLSFLCLLPNDSLTYLLSYLNIQDISLLDSAVTSTRNNDRKYLYHAFKYLCLTPSHFPKAKQEVLAFERINIYYDTVFSQLEKGPFIYEHRFEWLKKRHLKVILLVYYSLKINIYIILISYVILYVS